jgi:DNA repair ATPase RecN
LENEKFQELVLQQLYTVTEGQKQLVERIELIEKGQARLENRLDTLDTLENRLDTIENRLDTLDTLENRLDTIENRLDTIENRLDVLENGQTRIELRLENEIIPKITALFDGYQLRGDQIENLKLYLDGRLEAIALDINYLIGRVVRHDTAILELKRIK